MNMLPLFTERALCRPPLDKEYVVLTHGETIRIAALRRATRADEPA